jgi:hypothetical protein
VFEVGSSKLSVRLIQETASTGAGRPVRRLVPFGGAGFENGIEGVGVGGAELAGFFPDTEDGIVVEPTKLEGEEPGVGGMARQ